MSERTAAFQLGKVLCEALGIAPDTVSEIHLTVVAGDVPRLTVEHILAEIDDDGEIRRVLKQYRLEEA